VLPSTSSSIAFIVFSSLSKHPCEVLAVYFRSFFSVGRETFAKGKAGRGMSDKICHFNGAARIRRES
jgi:hypothetical protein